MGFFEKLSFRFCRGGSGLFFKPGLTKQDRIYLWNRNFCRAIPFDFQKEIEHNGIKGYRFTPSNDLFGSPDEYPENACFCVNDSCQEIPSGVFNVSECNFGAPVMMSYPHFLTVTAVYS